MIHIKIVSGRFVTCWPMLEPKEDEQTFFQTLHHFAPHRYVGEECDPWSDLRRKRMEEAAA